MRSFMTIKKVKGEPFRYRCASEGGSTWHFVDLTEREGQGRCDCKNFSVVATPNWKLHGVHIPWGRKGQTDCKHIHACKLKIQRDFVVPLLHSMRDGVTPELLALVASLPKPG